MKKTCCACGAEEVFASTCEGCGNDWASCQCPAGGSFGIRTKETHPLAFDRWWIGFVVSGYVGGGGGINEGPKRKTIEEAWADAQALQKASPFQDTVPGIRPVQTQ